MKLDSLAIKYENGKLLVLDQQALPQEEIWLQCQSIEDMCGYIRELKVRGAPLIGIAAVLALAQFVTQGASVEEIKEAINILIATRPTAVNLRNYMNTILNQLRSDPRIVLEIAKSLFQEDVMLCEKMAENGVQILPKNANVLTYCNTGSLATAGVGTALGVIKKGFAEGKIKHVYACETRPLLQGARLTAWELEKEGIPYTLISDNMAATLMLQGKIDVALVGADRIAMNGDTANKIGTYNVAVLCHFHEIPFYVVAPYTTFDKECCSGNNIIIEQRAPDEVKGYINKMSWAPIKAKVYNPSFDVTPNKLITSFIFDIGVLEHHELIKLMAS